MAPQKGGQANKQQPPPSQPHHAKQPSGPTAVAAPAPAAAAGNAAAPAKKPATAAAPAPRPAVVPAIPLPLLQRQSSKQQQQQQQRQHLRNASSNLASPTTVSSNGFPATSLEAALIDIQSGAGEPALALQKAAHAHAHAQKGLRTSGNGVPADAAGAPAAVANAARNTANGTRTANEKLNGHGDTPNKTNGFRKHPQPATNGTNGTNGVHAHGPTNGIGSITFGDVAPDLSSTTGRTTPDSSAYTSMAPSVMGDGESHHTALPPHQHQGPDFSENDPLSSSSAPTSQPQSATHLPADFMSSHAPVNGHHPYFGHQPEHFPPSNTTNGHGPGFPNGVPAPPHLHGLQHPANGNGNGIVFGGLGFDSHSSSPAPLSAGFLPPPGPFSRPPLGGIGGDNGPGFHPAKGHPAHMRGVSHGHAHTESNGNSFPLPLTPYRPEMNAMSSTMEGHGPHGPFDGHPPAMGHYRPSSAHGFIESAGPVELHGIRRMPPNFAAAVDLNPAADGEWLHSFARWMQQLFDSSGLSDCKLEFVFSHTQRTQKFHAHRLALAKSPTLYQSVMRIGHQDSNTISVVTADKYTHSEAWQLAIQHLYLFPLPNLYTFQLLRINAADHFFWCLSYAAAGHALGLRDVLVRGLGLAEGLIGWDTVEEGLSFALEGATHTFQVNQETGGLEPGVEFFYGPDTTRFVSRIIDFLVNQFPADFVLDKSVDDPVRFARIPPTRILAPAIPAPTPPPIACGSSGTNSSQDHGTGKAARLASLQFGDIPPAFPEDDSVARKPAQCSPELSRVLLNLPFPMLQAVLTSESNGISGWNTAQDRYHAVTEVVAEREKRRLRTVKHLRDCKIAEADDIKKRLSRESASPRASAWDVLNWQEEVVLPTTAGVPVLGRKWVPQCAAPPQDAPAQATV